MTTLVDNRQTRRITIGICDAGLTCDSLLAQRAAQLVCALFEPDRYDAALWKGAEAIYGFMDAASADRDPLRNRRLAERAMFLTMTVQCFSAIRLALEGGYPEDRMRQAVSDITAHKAQLAARGAQKVSAE